MESEMETEAMWCFIRIRDKRCFSPIGVSKEGSLGILAGIYIYTYIYICLGETTTRHGSGPKFT